MQGIPDQFMDVFGIVTIIHDADFGFSGSVTVFDQGFSMRDIMNRMLRDFQRCDDLLIGIDSDGSFQEPFSYLTRSP